MRLRITTPLTVIVDEDDVQVVSAEDASGGFGIQPHHADFLTSLATGVVHWKDKAGAGHFCTVHGGVLTVTSGQEVAIATREAIKSDNLSLLDQVIRDRFGADAAAERAGRVNSTKLQLQAIREIVRHLRPGMQS